MNCEPPHFRPLAVRVCDQKSGRLRRCAVLIMIAAFFLLPLVGCKHTPRQTMSGLWDSVPQVRGWGNRTESATPAKAEPSVGANVAASVAVPQIGPTAPDASAASEETAPRRDPALPAIVGTVATAMPTFTDRDSAPPRASQASATESPLDSPAQEQLERLEAALGQGDEPRHPTSTHDVRVRVDSLLEKSRRLFDRGELREARHTAKAAHDLGDAARLDYSPDEERPIDLVLQIDDRMREAAEQAHDATQKPTDGLANDAPPSTETSVPTPTTATPNVVSGKTLPSAKPGELDSTAKPRKNWTQSLSVFGRKVPTATAPEAAVVPSMQSTPEVPPIQLGLETDLASPEVNDGAVVQANRSLKLSVTPPNASATEPDSTEDPSPQIESSHPELDSTTESAESGVESAAFATRQPELASNLRSWRSNSTVTESPAIDESSPLPADLNDVEPLTPFRDMAGSVPGRADEERPITVCRSADYGWPVAITLFIACSIVAIFWYRRGAV